MTQFIAGTTHNIIPEKAEIVGTVRSFNPELRQEVPGWIEQIVKGITTAHGAIYKFSYEHGYRPVINDHQVTQIVEETVREIFGEETIAHLEPNMGGEDFSAFQQKSTRLFLLYRFG